MNPLFPRQADNEYRGHKLALWCFGALLLMRVMISVNGIVNGRSVAQGADGIPLDSYPPAAAQTALALFALVGLFRLTSSAIGIVVLVRYRTLVPLMCALLLAEQLARTLVLRMLPIVRVGSPPVAIINWILLALAVAGLVLSLLPRR